MSSIQHPSSKERMLAFTDQIHHLHIWAAVSASRSRDLQYEWLAFAFAFASIYILIAIPSVASLSLIDIFVLAGSLGTGVALYVFEYNVRNAMERLATDITDLEPSSTKKWERT